MSARILRRRFLQTAALGGLCLGGFPAVAEARTCEGISYPETKTVNGKTLKLNGLGIREATILKVDVYVAALYVERPSRNAADLLKLDQLEQMALTLVRDVDADTMNEAIDEGFKKNAGGNYGKLAARVETFRKAIPDLKKGHVFELTFDPGKGTTMKVNGAKRVFIEGDDFTRVLLKIWLGPNPPNSGLKRGLLGGEC